MTLLSDEVNANWHLRYSGITTIAARAYAIRELPLPMAPRQELRLGNIVDMH